MDDEIHIQITLRLMILAYSIRAFNIKSHFFFRNTGWRVFDGYHSESEPYPAKALTAPAASGWGTFAPLTVNLPLQAFETLLHTRKGFPKRLVHIFLLHHWDQTVRFLFHIFLHSLALICKGSEGFSILGSQLSLLLSLRIFNLLIMFLGSWCLNQPNLKIMSQNGFIFPKFRGWK